MQSVTVKIGSKCHQTLQELAAKSGESIQIILEKAIENYQRQLFLEEANQAFAALRNDPEAWQAEMAERSAWDVTLGDGLE
ncbi:MAG: toxin-antitoxin system protein [Oscillatoria sp. SIO1A7]|nr:toxin-antitoxin system protein [Oscillatoria sp. SIO1A7]